MIEEEFEGEDFVVVGNESDNFAISFKSDPGDDEGNMWNVFGTAVSGPRSGAQLENARSFMAYWFSIVAFYPNVIIYGKG